MSKEEIELFNAEILKWENGVVKSKNFSEIFGLHEIHEIVPVDATIDGDEMPADLNLIEIMAYNREGFGA